MSTKHFTLTLLPVVAAAFVASCAPRQEAVARICTDQGNRRVADDQCRSSSGAGLGGFYGWYYLTRGGAYPAVGEVVQGGSRSIAPNARPVGVSERGGFGASAEAHGGGKGSGGKASG